MRSTVESGFGYCIYLHRGVYYVEIIGKDIAEGFKTLQGAREHAYYQGYRDRKD